MERTAPAFSGLPVETLAKECPNSANLYRPQSVILGPGIGARRSQVRISCGFSQKSSPVDSAPQGCLRLGHWVWAAPLACTDDGTVIQHILCYPEDTMFENAQTTDLDQAWRERQAQHAAWLAGVRAIVEEVSARAALSDEKAAALIDEARHEARVLQSALSWRANCATSGSEK